MLATIRSRPDNRFCSSHVALLLLQLFVQGCWGQITSVATTTNIGPLEQGNENVTTSSVTTSPIINASQIDVTITLAPYIVQAGNTYVAVNVKLNISAVVSGFAGNSSLLTYKWSTKGGEIKTQPSAKDITYAFVKSEEDNFVAVTVEDPTTNATGSAKFDLFVRAPVVVTDPVGKLFLERGELLDISLKYSGSPPFKYCYKFCTPYDILPCNFCFPSYKTTSTVIPIIHYLHSVGNYTLVFQIENILNREEKYYAIKINDTVRKSNLPIAPIVSTILAVIILISGVALHLKFRVTPYTTETANFNFFNNYDDEDWEQEFSFIQRVKYLFCGMSDQDDEAEETRYLLRKSSPASSSESSGHGTNNTTTTTTTTAALEPK